MTAVADGDGPERGEGGGVFPSVSLSVFSVFCDSQVFSWRRFFNVPTSNMKE